jgi:leucyl-tRNA synthetase
MSENYDFRTIESKWQRRWNESGLFRAPELPDSDRKFYLLEMFAYPSGDIHLGHFRNYGIGDAVCRWLLMNGRDVLHPFGWDAFGLPAENAAIKRGIHPGEWTRKNIAVSRSTLQAVGMGYDWEREFATCEPDYYHFTQWIFLLLHERGLVTRKNAPVNWCSGCATVLANEQVQDGRCWRCESEVEKRDLEQWYIRITEYAQRLLDGLDTLPHWPRSTVASQRNWIGRSEGAELRFPVADAPEGCPEQCPEDVLEVFTTRPDTLWGVTFLAVAPESAFGRWCAEHGPNAAEVAKYAAEAAKKTEIERLAANREKTGVLSGMHAVHPTTGEKLPVFVADYVLASYGTGYVMAVPAHDERDFAFAKARGLPIRIVIQNEDGSLVLDEMEDAYTPAGPMVASGPFDGRHSEEAMSDLLAWLEEQGIGTAKVTFRLRDWLISRQRYWGCPIPMVHCAACGIVPMPQDQLPVRLPDNVTNWIPEGRSPLADVADFVSTTCPQCGGAAERDVDTMDTFIDSAWYHIRYTDSHNGELPFDPEKANAWMPVDLYIGGAEHANGHLLYFRFITKVLKDAGYLNVEEPVTRLFHHGMVADADGKTMSKSVGNVISPIDNAEKVGTDASRVAMFFFAPSADEIRWSEQGVKGAVKLVQRVYDLYCAGADWLQTFPADVRGDAAGSDEAKEARRKAHELLQRMDHAFAGDLALNPAVAGIYELLNVLPASAAMQEASDADQRCYAESLRVLALAMAPLVPHLAEEVHEMLGGEGSVFQASWPQVDPDALARDEIEIAVQVRGKVKARIRVTADADEETVKAAALAEEIVQKAIDGREIRKVIVVPGRLVNIVV